MVGCTSIPLWGRQESSTRQNLIVIIPQITVQEEIRAWGRFRNRRRVSAAQSIEYVQHMIRARRRPNHVIDSFLCSFA